MGPLAGVRQVFLDASFLVAVFGASDRMHGRALELLAEADAEECRLCTLWDCVGEALTVLRRHFGHAAACALAESLGELTLLGPDVSQRLEAVSVFRRFSRGRSAPSFVDALCAVVIARELGGAPALSFDRDFRRLGLTVIA